MIDRPSAADPVRCPRELPTARRPIPCNGNISVHRTPRSRRSTCISGRPVRRRCRPSPWLSRNRFPLIWSSFPLLAFFQSFPVAERALYQCLNAFIAGLGRHRVSVEKEPPFVQDFGPCPRRLREHLIFEVFKVKLPRACRWWLAVRGSPSHFRRMLSGTAPSAVEIIGSPVTSDSRQTNGGRGTIRLTRLSFSDARARTAGVRAANIRTCPAAGPSGPGRVV